METKYVQCRVKETGEQFLAPVVDIPMVSDYRWQMEALQSRLEHPEWYAATEDVEETVNKLKAWLEEHANMKGAA